MSHFWDQFVLKNSARYGITDCRNEIITNCNIMRIVFTKTNGITLEITN